MNDLLTDNIKIVYSFCQKNLGYAYLFGGYEDYKSEMVAEYCAKINKWVPEKGELSTFINTILINYIRRQHENRNRYVKENVSTEELGDKIIEDSYDPTIGDIIYYEKLLGALPPIARDYYLNHLTKKECLKEYGISNSRFYKILGATKEIISKIVENYGASVV
jgi:DNA-directed RNA polymerase specialized sigma24 family protein